MQKDSKFFADLAKMASTASGTLLDMKREMEEMATTQFEKMIRKMDLVTREDFDVVRDIAIRARAEQEKLEARVTELEKKLGIKPPAKKPAGNKTEPAKKAGTAAKPKPKAKTAAKKPATKAKPQPKTPAKKGGTKR